MQTRAASVSQRIIHGIYLFSRRQFGELQLSCTAPGTLNLMNWRGFVTAVGGIDNSILAASNAFRTWQQRWITDYSASAEKQLKEHPVAETTHCTGGC
jgi:hypothetical protein